MLWNYLVNTRRNHFECKNWLTKTVFPRIHNMKLSYRRHFAVMQCIRSLYRYICLCILLVERNIHDCGFKMSSEHY